MSDLDPVAVEAAARALHDDDIRERAVDLSYPECADHYRSRVAIVVAALTSTGLLDAPGDGEVGLPAEMRQLIGMLRTEPYQPYPDDDAGLPQYADVMFNFTPGEGWEVKWTGFNLPGNPNVCRTRRTLSEACQACIDAIEESRTTATAPTSEPEGETA